MPQPPRAMIYGANGYTGRLIARHAAGKIDGLVLSGRNHEAVSALARECGCQAVNFSLQNATQIAEHLQGYTAVLSCAGPFSRTARPLMEACLLSGTSYLDITGEIDVILTAAELSDRAKQAGISLLPAVGFDVVPSDCLAAMLAERLPTARVLQLAFTADGGMSVGTAKTVVESLPRGGRVRIDGKIRPVPTAWKTMEIPFRNQKRLCATIPWGDVASAFYSTGIPNIEVYSAAPPKQIKMLRRWRWLLPLLAFKPLQAIAKRQVEKQGPGPEEGARRETRSSLWGRVSDDQGRSATATLETMNGYDLTALTAVAALQLALVGGVPRGFATASQAFGREFILQFPTTDIRWEGECPTGPSSANPS